MAVNKERQWLEYEAMYNRIRDLHEFMQEVKRDRSEREMVKFEVECKSLDEIGKSLKEMNFDRNERNMKRFEESCKRIDALAKFIKESKNLDLLGNRPAERNYEPEEEVSAGMTM